MSQPVPPDNAERSPLTRVIFVNRYFAPDISATSQMLSDLCFALVSRGFDIVVVTSRSAYDAPEMRLPANEQLNGVEVRRVWTTSFGRASLPGRVCDYLSFYLSAFWMLLRTANRQDVIVAKTDPPLIAVAAAVVARLKGAYLVNWLQDVFPEVGLRLGVLRPGPLVNTLRKLRNWSLRAARVNVAIGSRMATLLMAEGAHPEAVRVIHNWADGVLIRPIKHEENSLRESWGLGGKFVVGYSGNLGRAHEFETMLGAAAALTEDSTVAFVFIGGGHGNKQLREAAAARGLSQLKFFPYQPQALLAQSLSAPDVHLVSLRAEMEGLIVPSKVYGIAAAGRPCIFIGDAGGEVAKMLEEGGFGTTVAPGDSTGLMEAIVRLRNNPELCRAQMLSARRFFEHHHTSEAAAARWESVLHAVSKPN